jgi:hypothetical protein
MNQNAADCKAGRRYWRCGDVHDALLLIRKVATSNTGRYGSIVGSSGKRGEHVPALRGGRWSGPRELLL